MGLFDIDIEKEIKSLSRRIDRLIEIEEEVLEAVNQLVSLKKKQMKVR